MKHLIIVTGPQGSGNHLWSKILALHPAVYGWSDLLDDYWIGHDNEPFNQYWLDPYRLHDFDWSISDYYVTSISMPYMQNGEQLMPDIDNFYNEASRHARVSLCVIGRDRNIIAMQQQRVRNKQTWPMTLSAIESLQAPIAMFFSFELLHLYRGHYLKQISTQLEFPLSSDDDRISKILTEDTNAKYFQPIAHHWVDDLARQTSRRRNG
jgi:hypothetical protein